MLYEVIIAHAAKGLYKGHSGFCPVAVTQGMPKPIVKLLADVTQHQRMSWSDQTEFTRQTFCHFPFFVEQRPYHLVSRGFCLGGRGEDGAPRWLVHHLVLDNISTISGGPAWLMANEAIWISHWELEPQYLEPRAIESQIVSPRVCEAWRQATGDAGWAGLALEAVQKGKSLALIVPPTANPLSAVELFAEAQSLLESKVRWEIPMALSTWTPPKLTVGKWTAFVAGTQQAVAAARSSEFLLVDLTRKPGLAANVFSEIARSGDWARIETRRKSSPATASATTVDSTPQIAPLDYRLFSDGDDGGFAEDPLPAPAVISSTTALQPSFRQAKPGIPWVKVTLVAGLLALAGLTIWQAFQFLNNALRVAAPAEVAELTPAPAQPRRAPVADANEGVETEESEATNSTPTTPGSGSAKTGSPTSTASGDRTTRPPVRSETPRLTAPAARLLFERMSAQNPVVAIPAPDAPGDAPWLRIPLEESLLPHVGIGLATPRQFVDLSDPRRAEADGKNFATEIAEPAGPGAATAELELRNTGSSDRPMAELYFRWPIAPSPELLAEMQLGAVVLWLRSEPAVAVTLPCEFAARGPALQVLRDLLAGVELSPGRAAELARPEYAERVDWIPRIMGYASAGDSVAVSSNLEAWLPPAAPGNPTNFFQLDLERFTTQIVAGLTGETPAEEGLRERVEQLVGKFAPIQFDIRLDEAAQPDAGHAMLALRVRALLYVRTADGSRNSIILQANPQETRPPKAKEFEEKIEADLRAWLARGLEVPEVFAKTFIDGGYRGKRLERLTKLDRTDEQIRTVLAESLCDDVLALLRRDLVLQVNRSIKLPLPQGEVAVEIPAYVGE